MCHTTDVPAAALLMPALSVCIELAVNTHSVWCQSSLMSDPKSENQKVDQVYFYLVGQLTFMFRAMA